jgi:hypothetical protein
MSQHVSTNGIMLPSELERQQIFYMLEKLSSVTAWRRIFEYFKIWAATVENSLREANERGWDDLTALPESEYVLILKCLAHCEEGVVRLGKGDKRVFKFDANGEFAMAWRILSHWGKMKTRIEDGENSIDEKHTPLWTNFLRTMTEAHQAWQECSCQILEPRYLGDPGLTLYNTWLKEKLKTSIFPDVIETVPDPIDNVFVRTNENIPYSGIWEPVEAPPKKTSLLSFFSDAPEPQSPFTITGAMNYLHGGSSAPSVSIARDDESTNIDTTWRLLWRDDRYTDGTIPAKEAHYRFNYPVKTQKAGQTFAITEDIVWAESGAAAPVSGTWLVESDINASITLEKGDKLPMHQGREVRWVLAVE